MNCVCSLIPNHKKHANHDVKRAQTGEAFWPQRANRSRRVRFLRFRAAAGNFPPQDTKQAPKRSSKQQPGHQNYPNKAPAPAPAPSTQHPAPAPAPRRCAAVPAQRFESAAHPCLQGVAERMRLGAPDWKIKVWNIIARDRAPNRHRPFRRPLRLTACRPKCFVVKNEQQTHQVL